MSKKVLVFIVFCLWFSVYKANSQTTILSENFEGGVLPTGWMRSQASGSQGWKIGSNLGSAYLSIPAHTVYSASNDDACNCNMSLDYLITPSLDLTSYPYAVIKFAGFAPGTYGSSAHLRVSTNSGATWATIYTLPQLSEWVIYYIPISLYCGLPDVKFAFHHNDNGQWGDGFAIDDVEIYVPLQNDVELAEISMDDYYPTGNISVHGKIKNLGGDTLKSIDINWTLNGGNINTQTISTLNLSTAQTYNFTHNIQVSLPNPEIYNLKVWVSGPNGLADMNNINDTLSKSLSALSYIPAKNVLVEEFTGTWCQYCPDGAVKLDLLLSAIPQSIGVAIHDGDAMEIPEGATVVSAYSPSFPSGMVDRFKFPDQSSVTLNRAIWQTKTNQRKNAIVPMDIEATHTYDILTRILNIDITTTFYGEVNDDLRINCYIVEDSVSGSGSGYNQANYYNNVSGHPYYGAGNPIVGFQHRHVLRKMLGGAWGSAGSIPVFINDGESFNKNYNLTLPAGWNYKRITIIALVQKYSNNISQRQILNSKEYTLNLSSTSIEESDNGSKNIKIYPNPASEMIYLDFSDIDNGLIQIELTDNLGRNVLSQKHEIIANGLQQMRLDIRHLSSGTYAIKITEKNLIRTEKIIIYR